MISARASFARSEVQSGFSTSKLQASPIVAAERTEEKLESAAAEEAKTWTPAKIAETYWEVFSSCFDGLDFNPVTFRFHEDGWDSASQMALVAGLEAAFGISFKGREVLKMNSFESGLNLVRKKLGEKNRGEG